MILPDEMPLKIGNIAFVPVQTASIKQRRASPRRNGGFALFGLLRLKYSGGLAPGVPAPPLYAVAAGAASSMARPSSVTEG